MSAFMCSPDTFDYLAAAAQTFDKYRDAAIADASQPDVLGLMGARVLAFATERVSFQDPYRIAQILRNQNIRSLQARYPKDYAVMLDDGDYEYRPVGLRPNPVTVLKSLACLEYQSCESDDFDQTLAYAVIQRIRSAAIHALDGYSDAPWGWTRHEPVEPDTTASAHV